eukprot:gene4748-5925_t
MYSNIITGKLKLKGSVPLTPSHHKKKKKKKSSTLNTDTSSTTTSPPSQYNEDDGDGEYLENGGDDLKINYKGSDYLTPAQRKHKKLVDRMEAQRISNLSNKTHKEKVEEYNKKLSNLSEHHDIPKV